MVKSSTGPVLLTGTGALMRRVSCRTADQPRGRAQLEGGSGSCLARWPTRGNSPLEVLATVRLPWIAELVIADVHHRVRSTASTESCLVRAELAAPQRRRIAVTTGPPGRPECILVDPVGHARFLYDIDAADS